MMAFPYYYPLSISLLYISRVFIWTLRSLQSRSERQLEYFDETAKLQLYLGSITAAYSHNLCRLIFAFVLTYLEPT